MYLMILIGGHFLHVLFGTQPDPFSTLTKSDLALWAASGAMHLLAYGFGLALITVLAVQRRYHQLRLRNSELRRDWAGARLAALRTQRHKTGWRRPTRGVAPPRRACPDGRRGVLQPAIPFV